MFIVASDGSFVFERTVILRSKLPHWFKSLKDASRPMPVHYFSNKKTWMNSDIIEYFTDIRQTNESRKTKLSCFGTMLLVILKLHRPV